MTDQDNGRETLDHYERTMEARALNGAITPQALLDATQSRAGMLAQCIYANVIQPFWDLDREVLIATGIALLDTLPPEDDRFPTRIARAFAWTARVDLPPETAVHYGLSVMARVSAEMRTELEALPEYAAFRARFKPVLDRLDA